MESLLGAPLEDVRIHEGAEGQRRTAQHDAMAVTEGTEIAFAPGAYLPGTPAGDALLAHELAHAAQQRDVRSSPVGTSTNEQTEEHEAHDVGRSVWAGRVEGSSLAHVSKPVAPRPGPPRVRRFCRRNEDITLEEAQQALADAETITEVGQYATSDQRVRERLAGANQRIGAIRRRADQLANAKGHVENAYDIIDSIRQLNRLQGEEGDWADGEEAARQFGRLFAAAGRVAASTNIPLLKQYGEWLSNAGDFFVNVRRGIVPHERARERRIDEQFRRENPGMGGLLP